MEQRLSAGTVNESKDIRQIGLSDTKGAAEALAQAPTTMAHQPPRCVALQCAVCVRQWSCAAKRPV